MGIKRQLEVVVLLGECVQLGWELIVAPDVVCSICLKGYQWRTEEREATKLAPGNLKTMYREAAGG